MGEFICGFYPRIGYDHFMPQPLGGLSTVSKEAIEGIPAPYRASYDLRDWRDMGAMTTALDDIRQLDGGTRRLAHNRNRAEVARLGILSQAMYAGALSLVDAPGIHTADDIESFLDNTGRALLYGDAQQGAVGIFDDKLRAVSWMGTDMRARGGWPGRRMGLTNPHTSKSVLQQATYGLAAHLGRQLNAPQSPGRQQALDKVHGDLTIAVAEQYRSGEVSTLLHLTQQIGGSCTAVAALMGEFVNRQSHESVRHAAHAFGAGAATLGRWSTVLGDLRGARTYATEFLRQRGVTDIDDKALAELAEMAQDSAAQQFASAREALGRPRQRQILKTMRWLVERKFALDRYKRPITPESVRTALAA